MTTILSLLQEMQTWCSFDADTIEKAENSNINTDTDSAFANLVEDWASGMYDEDPYAVANEIEFMLRD